MQNEIKNYLDEMAKNDHALAAVYDPNKIEDCCNFISEKIKEIYVKQKGRVDGGCYVEPEKIFKLARDFFIDAKNGQVQPLEEEDVNVIATDKPKGKTEEKVDIEAIRRQAVQEFKAKEKEKAEAKKKAAEEAREKKKAEAEAKKKAAEEASTTNQLDLFAGVL